MPETAPDRKTVQFEYRDQPGHDVGVAGSFNGWDPSRLRLPYSRERGLYEAALQLPRGRHEYRLVVDGTWRVDPLCIEWKPNGYGSLNSVVTVG